MTFTKLFSSITSSTVWLEDSDTRVVWITMLAMADRRGRVFASIPGLAKDAVVSVDSCRKAIKTFLSPDSDSRTKVAGGRRIEEIDGGWRLINHSKYRAIRDEEERRAYKTEKQREYRSVDNVDSGGQRGPRKTVVDAGGHNAEAEAEAEVQNPSRGKREMKKELKPSRNPNLPVEVFALPEWVPRRAWDAWMEVRKKKRAANTVHALELAIRALEKLKAQGANVQAVIEQSVMRGYTGLFEIAVSRGGQNGPRNGKNYSELYRELGLEDQGDQAGVDEHGNLPAGVD